MIYPSKNEFIKLTEKGNLIPVCREILGDLETPVSTYLKLTQKSTYSCLLESVEGEEKVARFSFIARDPELVLQSKDNQAQVIHIQKGKSRIKKQTIHQSPLNLIREALKEYQFVAIDGLPSFCGGFIGYLSYDVVRFFEKLPHKTKDDLKLPDMLLLLAKSLVIFDHRNHKLKIIECVHVPAQSSLKDKENAYQNALKRIEKTVGELNKPLKASKNKHRRTKGKSIKLVVKSNVSQSQFESNVEKAKEDIRSGEIIQVVLSQRFEVNLKTDPFNIYRRLRSLNPSPYMYYLNLGKIKIAGSSPELLVRCEQGIVETRPIAGTRKRGVDDKEDEALAKNLLSDPKEKAEHIMLVDLGRNDLGRVCKQGSVKLTEFMRIEKYSHVMHIVSDVQGELRSDKDGLDVLQAAFPAGTVSGAPKIRAMEIIEDLENVSRGPYAGSIGYFSFSGDLDTCITIRTIVVCNNKAYIQAGAGIVADSEPAKEFQETVNKAKAQIRAIELAHEE
jgi:anthranilate synthase component 1